MYVTIIDLQTLKIPSFFFGVSGNGVYTHFHPFPATFMEKLCHLGGPTSSASRTSEASALSEIVGEAKTLRLKNVGNVPFIVELC